MIGRIVDKIILSAVALVLMINVFESDSTVMVLAVLMTVMALTLTDIFRVDGIVFVMGILACIMTAINPGFALMIIPCTYGAFSAPRMGEIELHIYMLLRNRIKTDGVAARVADREKGMSTAEIIRLMEVLAISTVMIVMSGIAVGTVPVCISIMSVLLAIKNNLSKKLEERFFDKYDRARMEQLAAEEASNRIRKQSEDNAYMAMLQERNRIAREIHDNVGHMLTRAIVQMQAIKVINKDANIMPHLESVFETINTAMLNIRRSVHELHDESIDLSIMLNEIVKTLPDSFKVDCRTSIESAADTELKNTILGIVRESITNIAKYSKGDKVKVEIIEHAAFWRVFIFDNGSNERKDYSRQLQQRESGSGMGLLDIGNRAKRMNGTVNITADENGFTVLVIIPKGDR